MINQNDFPFGTCTDTADMPNKLVNIFSGKFVLKEGCTVFVKFTNTNSAAVNSITLNVNGTGAKPIKWGNGANLPSAGYLRAGQTIMFFYDGTNWLHMSDSLYNTDTVNRLQQNGATYATSAIVAGNIIVDTGSGYEHLKSNKAFYIDRPILYAGSNIAASATGGNNFIAINLTITTTQSITLTAYKPVYIRGKIEGTKFTPVSATPLIQTPNTTTGTYDDYILLGIATSTTAAYLLPEHPIFTYDGTTLHEHVGAYINMKKKIDDETFTTRIEPNSIYMHDSDTEMHTNITGQYLNIHSSIYGTNISDNGCNVYEGDDYAISVTSGGIYGYNGTYDQTPLVPDWSILLKGLIYTKNSIYNAIFIANGATGYYKVAQIQIKKTYADKVISFEFIRRVESSSTKVEIQFNSVNTLDPTLKVFRTIGPCDKVYIKKTDTSTWDLYIEKQQAYDSMTIFNYQNPYDSYGDTIVLTWYTQFSASSSAISGWTQAGYNSLVTSVNQSIANSTPISYGNKTSSYIKINFYNSSNKIMICWGVVNSSSSGYDGDISDATVVFPKSYGDSNYIPTVLLQPINSEFMVNNPNENVGFSLSSVTYSNFVVQFPSSKIFERAKGFYWFSIGKCT